MKRILLLVLAVFSITLPVLSQNFMLVHKSDGDVWEIPVDDVDSVSFVFRQPTNEIWYTTTDGNVITLYNVDGFGASIVSNEYKDGKGIITFDGPVTMIGDESSNGGDWKPFYNCRTLSTISLPSSVRKIGYSAFGYCNSLKELILPDYLDFLGPGIVSYAPLTTITIPESAVIDGNPVYWCSSLSEFKGPYATDDGYALVKDKTLISFVNEGVTQYVVPDSVTAIGKSAFIDCNNLVSVTLHNGVTSIGWGAFMRCSNLTGFVIPESVSSVGFGAFKGTSLTSIHIPENTTLEGCPFDGCNSLASFSGRYASSDGRCLVDDRNRVFAFAPSGLKEYSMPEGITAIRGGFEGVTGLEDLILPSTITEITQINSSSIKNITCLADNPPRVTYASNSGLSYLRSLEHIYVPKGSVDAYKAANVWSNHAGKILPIPEEPTGDVQPNDEIWYTTTDGKVVEPTNTDKFGATLISNTYEDGKGIWKFDGEVTMVGDETINGSSDAPFCYVYRLKSVKFPESVRKLGNDAFYNCFDLEEIQLPSHLDYFGYSAIEGTAVKELFVPECDSICSGACHYNNSLSTFSGPYASSDGRCLIKDNRIVSFAPAGLTTYSIPNGVQSIGYYSFAYCGELTSIVIPESVSLIEYSSFLGTGLTSLDIPATVRQIDSDAFGYCLNLTQVYIPENTEIHDWGVFGDCSSLTRFSGRYASDDGRCLIKNKTVIDFASAGIDEYTFPAGVEKIKYCYTCGVQKLNIPSSISEIYYLSCDSIREITSSSVNPPQVMSMGHFVNLESIYVPAESVGAYKAAYGWSDYADFIKAIQDNQSGGQQGSGQPNDEIWYTSMKGDIVTPYLSGAFGANIVSNTYENGKGVIKFDSPVTMIGDNAFYNCQQLTSLVIPNGVTAIGEEAFENCFLLKTMTVPGGVTSIGDFAFCYCSLLEEITLLGTVPPVCGESIFEGVSDCSIYVPTESVEDYKTAQKWSAYADDIQSIANSGQQPEEQTLEGNPDGSEIWYTSTDGEIIDPSTVSIWGFSLVSNTYQNGKGVLKFDSPISSVWSAAFRDCKTLSSVKIPEGVTSIEWAAFKGCANLTSVSIPESLTEIESEAFEKCVKLRSILLPASLNTIGMGAFDGCTRLATVNFPDNLVSIENYAFNDCSSLASINIPESVTNLGDGAFGNCLSLIDVTIPGNVGTVGAGLFSCCLNLESVTIMEGIRGIGEYAFNLCKQLTSVSIPSTVSSIGFDAFASTKITSVYIPEGVTVISDRAFYGTSLTSVTIPEGVTSIGNYAFFGCSNLETVSIPSTVISIGNCAFELCSNLKSVTIPDNFKTIGGEAFSWCSNLTSITFPMTLESMGASVLSECRKLEFIRFASEVPPTGGGSMFVGTNDCPIYVPAGSVTAYKTASNWSAFADRIQADPDQIINHPYDEIWYTTTDGNIIVPHIANGIGVSIVSNTYDGGKGILKFNIQLSSLDASGVSFGEIKTLRSVDIPESVKNIGRYAFENCSGLIMVSIPEGAETIGKEAFSGCSALKGIAIPGSVTVIGDSAFRDCSALTLLSIPKNVVEIGRCAFVGCNGLTSITVDSDNTVYDSRNGCNAIIETATGCLLTGCFNTTIPNGTTKIGRGAFYSLYQLTTMTIPSGVTTIDDIAFYNCENITSMTIPEGVTSLGESCFELCVELADIELPDGLLSIGIRAFDRCRSIVSLDIPESLRSIGAEAFSGCSQLAGIIIPEGITAIGTGTFYECVNMVNVTIPSGLKSIGDYAFYCCQEMDSLTIPEGVTSIGKYAFGECRDLTDFVIPSSVNTIGEGAFYECALLKSISIPNGVSEISPSMFSGCITFRTVTIPESVTNIGDSAFYSCLSLHTLTFPRNVNTIGKDALTDCFMNSVTFLSQTPPIIYEGAFDFDASYPIYVPSGSVNTYKAAQYWRDFADRIKAVQE